MITKTLAFIFGVHTITLVEVIGMQKLGSLSSKVAKIRLPQAVVSSQDEAFALLAVS